MPFFLYVMSEFDKIFGTSPPKDGSSLFGNSRRQEEDAPAQAEDKGKKSKDKKKKKKKHDDDKKSVDEGNGTKRGKCSGSLSSVLASVLVPGSPLVMHEKDTISFEFYMSMCISCEIGSKRPRDEVDPDGVNAPTEVLAQAAAQARASQPSTSQHEDDSKPSKKRAKAEKKKGKKAEEKAAAEGEAAEEEEGAAPAGGKEEKKKKKKGKGKEEKEEEGKAAEDQPESGEGAAAPESGQEGKKGKVPLTDEERAAREAARKAKAEADLPRTVFVNNLPLSISKKRVIKFFHQVGAGRGPVAKEGP